MAPAISEKYVALLAHSPSASQVATDTFRITENHPGVNPYSTQDGTKKFIAPDTTTEMPGDRLTDDELPAQLRKEGILGIEVRQMFRITKESWERAQERCKKNPQSEEERQRFLDAHQKVLSLSSEERRKIRREVDKDDLIL